jgi:threonine dehydrogenase-like Zn-dependent dehydrogenase
MKAITLVEPGQVEIVDLPEPTLGSQDVMIEIRYVGLCGSDLNAYRGRSPLVTYPRVLGHEVGGAIAAAGQDVPSHLATGARVTLSPYSHCGSCLACRTGRTNACPHNQTLGVQRDGALTERIVAHHSKVCTSEVLSFQELALVEPMSVGCHATTVGRVAASDRVAVFGCGAVGLGAVACCVEKGATVIAIDIDATKLMLAAHFGAEQTVNAAEDDAQARIDETTDREGVTVAIEAVGISATFRTALQVAATGGRVVCVGYSDQIAELDTRLIVKKELQVLGSRNARDEFQTVTAMMENRKRPFTEMISRVVPFEETAQAFAEWSSSPQHFTKILVQV